MHDHRADAVFGAILHALQVNAGSMLPIHIIEGQLVLHMDRRVYVLDP